MDINHEVHEEKQEHSAVFNGVGHASRFIWSFFVRFVSFVVSLGCIQ